MPEIQIVHTPATGQASPGGVTIQTEPFFETLARILDPEVEMEAG